MLITFCSKQKQVLVRDTAGELYLHHSSIDDWIKELERAKEDHKDKLNLRIDYSSHDDGYESYYRYFLVYDRPETDAERNKRLEAENNHKEWRRKQFESIKKEFEP